MKFTCNTQYEKQERQRHANCACLKTNTGISVKCFFRLEESLAEVTGEERSCANACTLLMTEPMSAHSSWLSQCLHTPHDCANACTLLMTVPVSAHSSWLCQCLHTLMTEPVSAHSSWLSQCLHTPHDWASVCTLLMTVPMPAHSSWLHKGQILHCTQFSLGRHLE